MKKLFKFKFHFMSFLLFTAVVVFIFFSFVTPTINEVINKDKASSVQSNLNHIRIALEEYYQKMGYYPELTRDGVNLNLTLLNSFNDKGEFVSFSKIYGNVEFPYTESSGDLKKSNKIINSNDFNNIDGSGGWVYDFSGQTGEIHPNLPKDIYNQNIDWKRR